MKRREVLEGLVERVDYPNKGILTAEGRKVTVKNTIPGQKIRFRVLRTREGDAAGNLVEVLEKSPLETCPKACAIYPACGGCLYQQVPYDRQLALKEDQVRRLLEPYFDDDTVFEGIKASPHAFAYRNKMEFSFGDEYKDGPLALGMHKRGSFHDIVNVSDCQIVDEDYRKILACTLEYAKETGLPYYHKMRHTGYFRHLLVRKAVKTGEILIDMITTGENEDGRTADLHEWVQRLTALELDGKIAGILHTRNDSLADAVKDEGTETLYGQSYFYEELLGLKFKITPFSFFQTNSLGAEVLYEKAREYIGETKDKVIFDLYSGTGTIAQILAPVAEKVVGVEIVEEAVEAAKENAKLNGLSNCTFWAGDVLKVIDELGEKPDLIVLDPPRDGVHPKALEKITNFGVEKMVYIACKPTSLARDLEMLQGRGYQVERIACVDLFPGTYHVETVCLLSKLSRSKNHVEVEFDMN